MPRAKSPGVLAPAISAERANTKFGNPIPPSCLLGKNAGGRVPVYYFVDKELHNCLFSGTSAYARPGVSPLKDRLSDMSNVAYSYSAITAFSPSRRLSRYGGARVAGG
jgi:hypothetical protein